VCRHVMLLDLLAESVFLLVFSAALGPVCRSSGD